MKADAPKRVRKKAVRLSDAEKWLLAIYCIENKCVNMSKEGKFANFRMFVTQVTREINEKMIVDGVITEAHIKDAMSFYNEILDLTGKMPTVPIQDNVQDDILKAENAKLRDQLDNYKRVIRTLVDHVIRGAEDTNKRISTVVSKIDL